MRQIELTTFHIKLAAIVSMIVDHVGIFFFPNYLAFRIVGRFGYPLFAWLISNGAVHTKNINAYFIRLFVFAIISQVPYAMLFSMNNPSYIGPNIFFTLLMGLGGIILIRKYDKSWQKALITLTVSVLAFLLRVDYGVAGVLSIITFYVFRKDIVKLLVLQAIIFSIIYYSQGVLSSLFFYPGQKIYLSYPRLAQPLGVTLIPLLSLYRGKEGPKLKYIFYPFYAVHLAIIYLIKSFF